MECGTDTETEQYQCNIILSYRSEECRARIRSITRKLENMTGEGVDQSQALDLLKSLRNMKINVERPYFNIINKDW